MQQIIVQQLGVDADQVTPKAEFVNDLSVDSLDAVELVMAFEEAYDLEISEEDAEKVRTVQDVVDYLARAKVKLQVQE